MTEDAPEGGSQPPKKLDGRTLRRTNRTHQFATRLKPETHRKMYEIAERDGILLAELIELAVEAYERERDQVSQRE